MARSSSELCGPTTWPPQSGLRRATCPLGRRLIVLVAIRQRADGGFTFDVERVLKGSAPRQLVYPPVAATPPLGSWRRAVIAFADPATDDYRAPTIAWHVTLDGRIDPERYQQYAGLPMTLAAVLDWFGLPATDTRPVASA